MADFDWTDQIINHLRTLWDEGHSTAEIGRRLGVSKNAIVGKAGRLDLPSRPSPIRRSGEPRSPRPQRIQPEQSTIPPLISQQEAQNMVPEAIPSDPRTPPKPQENRAVRTELQPDPRPVDYGRIQRLSAAARSTRQTSPFDNLAHRPVKPEPAPVLYRVRECCWPIGEPGKPDFRFCDVPHRNKGSYCEDHATIARAKPTKRTEAMGVVA